MNIDNEQKRRIAELEAENAKLAAELRAQQERGERLARELAAAQQEIADAAARASARRTLRWR